MLKQLFSHLDQSFGIQTVSAHCDIPCKIYDPISAQLAALSVIRFSDLIAELSAKGELSVADQAQLGRLVSEKEIHAAKVKEEVRVIWGDYFKAPQFEKFPNTNELVHKIMLQASKCKQNIEPENGHELLTLVNEFAASFWATKGVETFTATCPYPPEKTVVYPKLG